VVLDGNIIIKKWRKLIIKFKNSYRFSPVITMGDLPWDEDLFHVSFDQIPKNKKERTKFVEDGGYLIDHDWWKKQYDRCINGYTVEDAIEPGGDAIRDGIDCIWKHNDCWLEDYDITIKNRSVHISGRLYFYLNFWWIYGLEKNSKIKKIIRPRFIDVDYLVDLMGQNMFRYELDTQLLKGRQIGASEKLAGMWLGYNYTFLAASVNLIVAGEQKDADHTMENTIRGLDMLINTQFYLERKRGGDNQETIISVNGSQVRAQTAKDKPQTLSRYAPTFVLYEEIGKGKKKWSLDVEKYVLPSIHTEGKKTGYQFFVGTGGEVEEGVYDLEERYFKPEKYGILSVKRRHTQEYNDSFGKVGTFIPKWMFLITDKDGNSLRKESISELEKKAPTSDEDKYKYWSQHPIYDHHVFMTTSGGYFGKDIIIQLNKRKIELKNMSELQIERRGRLEPIDPLNLFKGIKFVEDKDHWWITIIEEPEIDKEGKVYANLYKAGCLIPGEMVMTNNGLKHVENVMIDDKLINESGNYVDIKKFFKRDVDDISIYKFKMSNTYRTNAVTEEHPILITKPKFNWNGTIKEESFDFKYIEAKNVNIGDWTRIPNLYNKSVDLDIDGLWDNGVYRIDRQIVNPLLLSDFWWFVGLWLGDGYCQLNGDDISISFNSKETEYINRLESIIKNVFNRRLNKRERNGATECTFSFQQLNVFITYNFGKYANGKLIPEWVKYISNKNKYQLLLGYFNSDGCVYKHPKGYFSVSYVSINLELLESIQDIMFSVGIVSNLCRLRDESEHIIRNITIKTKKCYQLRLGHCDTLLFIDKLNCINDTKFKKMDFVDIIKTRKRPKEDCFISEDGNYIYFKIKEINKYNYSGLVYNFECDTNTYIGHHIGWHNCDSYDRDEAETSASKGAMTIRKMFRQGQDSPHFNTYCALIVERPKTSEGGAEKFYYHTVLTCIYYGCRNNIEYGANNMRIFDYYIKNGFEVLLQDRPDIAFAGQIKRSVISNRYGTDASLKHQGLAILKNTLTPEFINRMFILSQVEAFSRFVIDKDYNCDITMSAMEAEVLAKDEQMHVVFSISDNINNRRMGMRVFQKEGGRILQKII